MALDRRFHSVNVKTIELIIHSIITRSNEMKVMKFIRSTIQLKESLSVFYDVLPN